jgi:hypothetical protein
VTGQGTNLDADPNYTAYFRVDASDAAGNSATDNSDLGVSLYDPGVLSVQAGVPVKDFELTSVGPNPSRGGRVAIQYSVAKEAHIGVSVVDIQGRTVAELANGTFRPGRYQAVWNGTLAGGNQAPAGMYFVRYQIPGKYLTKRIVVAQ